MTSYSELLCNLHIKMFARKSQIDVSECLYFFVVAKNITGKLVQQKSYKE